MRCCVPTQFTGSGFTLSRSNVGQHVIADHVADCVNAFDAGLKILIDLDKVFLHGDAGLVKPEAFSIGRAANGHQHQVNLFLLIAEADNLLFALGLNLADRSGLV